MTTPNARQQLVGGRAAAQQDARAASAQTAFLLPHLKPGMRLLDCGCGPGNVTLELAKAVAPGQVVGIDIDPSILAVAEKNRAQGNLRNVKFQIADVYALPFEDSSFSAVYAGALRGHLSEPLRALREMRRVLKPGGLIGIRDADFAGLLVWPPCEAIQKVHDIYWKVVQHYGRTSGFSRDARAILREAGFVRCVGLAFYEYLGTPEDTRAYADLEIRFTEQQPYYRVALEQGWIDEATLTQMREELRAWGEHPDAFFARSLCAAIGWKEV